MKVIPLLVLLFLTYSIFSQVDYGTPDKQEIPEKIKGLKSTIKVNHFPSEVDPVKIKDTYYWKHNTAILSSESDVTIIEYGAYIYYNDQWNLREVFSLKELDNLFGTKKHLLLAGEPYTWPDNWRKGKDLFAGWALWYFIGNTTDGTKVCGYQTIYTSDNLLN